MRFSCYESPHPMGEGVRVRIERLLFTLVRICHILYRQGKAKTRFFLLFFFIKGGSLHSYNIQFYYPLSILQIQ